MDSEGEGIRHWALGGGIGGTSHTCLLVYWGQGLLGTVRGNCLILDKFHYKNLYNIRLK